MPVSLRNTLVFHKVTGVLLLALLAGCGSAEKPQTADVEGMTRLAEELHEKGNDEAAADFYRRALEHSDDPQIHEEFGEVLEAHGDLNGAALQYRLALGIPPTEPVQYRAPPEIASKDVGLLRAYGRVLIKLGQPGLAQPIYARAVQLNPEDVHSLNGLGISLDQLNNHDAAQKIYHDALTDKPDDPGTLANLGHSYVLAGAYQDAIHLLEPHLSDPDATPALRQNLAEAYGMAGMDADAERVSKLDLAPAQVKHNLAYYRSRRAHLSPAGALYADLGHFPTEEMAAAHIDDLKQQFPKETEELNVAVIPEVTAIGGTPSFIVHVTGFAKVSSLRNFCFKLKKQKIACTARLEL